VPFLFLKNSRPEALAATISLFKTEPK